MSLVRRPTLLVLLLPLLALLACVAPGITPPQPTRPAGTQPDATLPVPAAATAAATPGKPTPALPTTARPTSAPPTALPPRPTSNGAPTANPLPAPTFTAGPLPAPTASGIARVELRLDSPQPAPVGILPQVIVFQTGGGGSGGGAACENQPGKPHWCTDFKGAALPQTETYSATACGFTAAEISARVLLPDGRSQPAQVSAELPGCPSVTYLPGPDAPPGGYQITLSQGSAQLTDTFQLAAPTQPDGGLVQNCAWLAALPEGQPVRLLAFGLVPPLPNDPTAAPDLEVWRFLGETSLSPTLRAPLDKQRRGSVLACPAPSSLALYPEFVYLAYLADAGAAPILVGDADLLQQFQGVCANGLPTRLATGKQARVQVNPLTLFSDAALNETPLALLNSGALVSILAGPACPTTGPWTWQVKTAQGQTGWLAEADSLSYFLEPLP